MTSLIGSGNEPPSPHHKQPRTAGAALLEAVALLDAAGIVEPRREARLILAMAMNVDPAIVLGYPERAVDDAAQIRLEGLIARRLKHEPFSRLKGSREFWSLDFALSPDTLDPRPDSETLIEAALAHLPDRSAALRIIDFGTGTGCLLLALLSALPEAAGLGVDRLPGAVETARRNAARLGLEGRALFRLGDWDREITGMADVILANPPYIPSNDIAHLAPEVAAFEPRGALDGGTDGLDAYRILAPAAQRLLTPRGIACFEIGAGQATAVAGLLSQSGLKISEIRRDLAGIERCLVARL
jgi:release factor glutamine methyltransferase